MSGGLTRESLQKTLATLAMVIDSADLQRNPARDRRAVKPPREDDHLERAAETGDALSSTRPVRIR
jgi:hypothetical protein